MVKVWDPVVRVIHWTLVCSFFIAYFTDDDFLNLHVWAGYIVISLVILRILWGIIGSKYARFTNFVYRKEIIRQFLMDTLRLRAPRYLGHNPAGGAMIIILLLSLLLTTLSGLAIYAAEESAGPLAGMFAGASEFWSDIYEELHEFFANLTVFLVLLHVAGVVIESAIHRENLIGAMWHGYKRKKD
jgi:cytochrome b